MLGLVTLATIIEICSFGEADMNQYNKYGGWKELNTNKSDFFRVENINGIWWIIDPEGYAFISKGVNHISWSADHAPSLGYSPYERVTKQKYGEIDKWASASIKRLWEWNFNTIGAWSSRETFNKDMPYTVIMDIGASAGSDWLKGSFPDVFSENFRNSAERIAESVCKAYANDPFLLGYFTDNELRWGADWRSPKALFDDFLTMPENTDGKKALVKTFVEVYGNLDTANKAFNINAKTYDELIDYFTTAQGLSSVAFEIKKVKSAFLKKVADQYFKVCKDAIRKFDQNHLILGCRFAGYAPTEVLEAMRDHVDIVSYNNYSPEAPINSLEEIYRITGKPIMITEFSFKAMDSGLPNTKGAGVPVATQKDRADGFERYVKSLMKTPYVVGYHWFEHTDEPAEGRFDGENSNYGLVNIKDEPWEILVNRMKQVNAEVERIHSNK